MTESKNRFMTLKLIPTMDERIENMIELMYELTNIRPSRHSLVMMLVEAGYEQKSEQLNQLRTQHAI